MQRSEYTANTQLARTARVYVRNARGQFVAEGKPRGLQAYLQHNAQRAMRAHCNGVQAYTHYNATR